MPRSLVNGDYSLIMVVESASRAESWYRVLVDNESKELSCDCPAWIYWQDESIVRSCKHTRTAQGLSNIARLGSPVARAKGAAAETNVLVQATRQQWPGLGGVWSVEQRDGYIDSSPYHFVVLSLKTASGITATGAVTFAKQFHPTKESMVAGVAGWVGYTLAASVARSAGYTLAGQPPQHFKLTPRQRTGRRRTSLIGLRDILRVGDQIDLGDGYTPEQRAENTLRLFLGEELYAQLEQQHFLDVSSSLYANEQRVYRIRRDPHKAYDRRVRVFKHGVYSKDFCIVRNQNVPEADHWLTVFLRLISDEAGILDVVKSYNVFERYSDGDEKEIIPVHWQSRVA